MAHHRLFARMSTLEFNALLNLDEYISIVGLVLSLFTLYWLLRIKRNFRQDLILCIVINDILKALSFLILPLVKWSGVNVSSSAPYCQFSGWLMAFSMEGGDYLMLVVALQTMLYVLNPPQKAGRGGVYKYRYLVYALWIIVPGTLASLAFVNKNGGYISLGSLCYMPATPIWYRIVLAWVPRSLCFFTIVVSYAVINLYVYYKFKAFKSVGSVPQNRYQAAGNAVESTHPSSPSSPPTGFDQSRKSSKSSQIEDFITVAPVASSEDWESMDFITSPLPVMQPGEYPFSILSEPNSPGPTRPALKRSPTSMAQLISPKTSPLFQHRRTQESLDTSFPNNSIDEKRMAIKQQVKNLFIYPITYLLIWMFPLVAVIWQYSHPAASDTPYWMVISYTISLAGQPMFDSCVILWRERPWKREKAQLPEWTENIAQRTRRFIPSRKSIAVLPTGGQASTDSSVDPQHWWEKQAE